MKESQHTEWKASWRDDHLRWVCGFANAEGSVLVIGRYDKRHTKATPEVTTEVAAARPESQPESGTLKQREKFGKNAGGNTGGNCPRRCARPAILFRGSSEDGGSMHVKRTGSDKGGHWEVLP